MLRTMALKDLNPHIICVLCGGYLVDATTIVECLHSFCRACIVRYLETSYRCPVCDVEIHKTRPLLNIRSDHVLQDIVYKLVPGLYYEEKKRRVDAEENLKPSTSKEAAAKEENKVTEKQEKNPKNGDPDIEDPVCITLEFYRRQRNTFEKQIFPTRYLRCSSSVPVRVLKKFLTIKFGIPPTHRSELVRCDEILEDHLTLKELTRIYGLYAKPFLDLQYLFIAEGKEEDEDEAEQRAKRLKTEQQQKQQELFLRYKKQQQRRLELERQEREEQERVEKQRKKAQEEERRKSSNGREQPRVGHVLKDKQPVKHVVNAGEIRVIHHNRHVLPFYTQPGGEKPCLPLRSSLQEHISPSGTAGSGSQGEVKMDGLLNFHSETSENSFAEFIGAIGGQGEGPGS